MSLNLESVGHVTVGRLLFLTDILSPYQSDFLVRLAAMVEVKVLFIRRQVASHDWQMEHRPWMEVLGHSRKNPATNRLLDVCRSYRPDFVLIGGYRLPLAELAKWWGLTHGSRVWYWLEKPLPAGALRAALRRLVWLSRLPFAHGIIGIGRQAVAAYAPYARATLNVPYSIDVARYPARSRDASQGPVRFLFVGQFISRKGVEELLQAFAGVDPVQAELTFAGSGEMQPIVGRFATRYSHIHLVDFVKPAQMPVLYSDHDVFVLPSRHDGWAVVVAEAMAAGLPVIGTEATGAVAEFIRHGENGWICQVDPASIRAGIEYYLARRDLITAHGMVNRALFLASSANAENAARSLVSSLGLASSTAEEK